MTVYDYDIDISDENSSHVKILNMVGRQKDVLEVGCATGYLTRYMKEKLGCRVVGIEIEAGSADIAEQYCEDIIFSDVEQLSLNDCFEGKKFDLILLADVIEHLKDALRIISSLRGLLNPEGCMVLSVPNGVHGAIGLELLDGKWGYQKEGLLDSTHLHFFDKDSLIQLLEKAGFFVSELDRVIIHPRDTELKTAWESYPREVTAYMEKVNPEYQTYQFVLKIFPMTMIGWKNGLEEALLVEKRNLKKQIQLEDKMKVKLSGEINRLENEIGSIHRGYQNKIKELESEASSFHRGYQSKIKDLESETSSIHSVYQEKISDLEREIAMLHQNNKPHIEHEEIRSRNEIEKLLRRMKMWIQQSRHQGRNG